jgi:uncharacterized membrane protein (DUF2068 family)
MAAHDRSAKALPLIGAFKLLKGMLLIGVAIEAHRLAHANVQASVLGWVRAVRVDPNNHIVHAVVGRIARIDERRLRQISLGTLLYAALYLTEGVGLLRRLRWAEYLTVVSTSLLLPIEGYELVRHPSTGKLLVLLINAAVVTYLIYELRRQPRSAVPPPP